MNDNEDEQITKKLQELQNFPLAQEGLLVGSDFKSVLVKVQELLQKQPEKINLNFKDFTLHMIHNS